MLSGDKTETALNVGVATSLIRRGAHLSRYLWRKDSENSERLEAQLSVDLAATEKKLSRSRFSCLLCPRSLISRLSLRRRSNSVSSSELGPRNGPVSSLTRPAEEPGECPQSCGGSPSGAFNVGDGRRSEGSPLDGGPDRGGACKATSRAAADPGRLAGTAGVVHSPEGLYSAEAAAGADRSLQAQSGGNDSLNPERVESGSVPTTREERRICERRSEKAPKEKTSSAGADVVGQPSGRLAGTPGMLEHQEERGSIGSCSEGEANSLRNEKQASDDGIPPRDQERASRVGPPPEALIVDGEALAFLLAEPQRRKRFIRLCCSCVSVICCRVAPHQKVRSVTRGGDECVAAELFFFLACYNHLQGDTGHLKF